MARRRRRLRPRHRRTPNAQGNYQYAYAGLGALSGFVDVDLGEQRPHADRRGRATRAAASRRTAPLADRQWMTFTDDHTVLLTYNQQSRATSVVQKSTDGGLTYSPAPRRSPRRTPTSRGRCATIPSLHTVVHAVDEERAGQPRHLAGRRRHLDRLRCREGRHGGGRYLRLRDRRRTTAPATSTSPGRTAPTTTRAWPSLPRGRRRRSATSRSRTSSNTPDGQPTVQPGFTAPCRSTGTRSARPSSRGSPRAARRAAWRSRSTAPTQRRRPEHGRVQGRVGRLRQPVD